MQFPWFPKNRTARQQILDILALSAFGILGIYSIYDTNTRLHFAEVCKLILAAYVGYLIPNK